MSPSQRERAYEKRRYEKWQAKQQARAAQRRRRRRLLLIGGAALGVIALISGTFWVLNRGDEPAAAPADADAPKDTACPEPTVKPPAKPKSFAKAPAKTEAMGKSWNLTVGTTCGDVTLALDGAKSPQAVSSMLKLAREGFFDGSPCHRLTTEGIYVLQCGDPTGTGSGGPGYTFGPVENAPKDAMYPAGTVAMARASDPNSMGSQFFLVYKDSEIAKGDPNGYTVLGRITSGLDVVTKVAEGGVVGDIKDGAPKRAVSIARTTVAPG